MLTKEDAKSWLKTVVSAHVPSNATSYRFKIYTEQASENATLGIQVDLSPQEGKVVELTEDWCLVKTARTEFFVSARHLLASVPEVGSTVKITPYARRQFDGRRLDEPDTTVRDGIVSQAFHIGRTSSELPIDKASLRCEHLVEMIRQVEEMKSPDGVRRLSQVLIDAGALTGPVAYKDPVEEDIIAMPPTLQFRVASKKFSGQLNIVYDRAGDVYRVQLVDPNTAAVVKEVDFVCFSNLAETVFDLVDDGSWKIAQVEILKPAPKRRAKKADSDELQQAA
ncbi:hypothetical protein [Methylibium petroleiphilum]|uniref:Uncharacterized protein n=1 Tax=Methylibium petroleiphilum (strain ATCC BAA-1232 / LMG 22953 / PM1) TaxID=420662 RepID=A2SN98_METPP|nr:hypothetical protein [Methylibium petroleiphilum]ABM97037.1 conserved hypothetical protein [Methylibium petroleiphilum PM1]